MINTSHSETRILIANQNIKEKKFWLDQLSGDPQKSNFPFDFDLSESSDEETHMAEVSLSLTGKTFSKLMKLCNGSDYTLNAVLITAVKILLTKYTGSNDIIIGTPIYQQQESAGPLINTELLLRTRFEDNITLKQLLLGMIQSIREATEHYNYPLELLREKLDIASGHGEFSLFDMVVLLENIHHKGYIRHQQLNMIFSFHRKDESIDGIISFNPLRYHEDTVQKIAAHLVNLAGRLRLSIDSPAGAIDILSEHQKHQLLVDFNQTRVDYPHLKTIQQLFEEQVLRTPGHTVLEEPGHRTSLTYNQLNRQANRLAWVIRTRGVRADAIIGLLMGRTLDLVLGMLAILKAGGAYLPIDTGTPIQRIQTMLKDGAVKVLLTHSREPHSNSECDVLAMDRMTDLIYMSPDLNPESVNNAADLAYVNYTSGSTGMPKGVLVMHRNVTRLVINSNFVPLNRGTCILQTGSPEFDASTFETWGSLLNGGKLVLAGNDVILDVENLGSAIRRHNVNTMWLTSPLFNRLVRQKSEIFAPLAYLVVGGDKLVPAMINRVRKAHPHLTVVNGYGPTENTTFSTTFRIDRDYDHSIPIGKPIANSSAYILDTFNHPVPVGVVGELYVGGDGVSRGYLNNPQLTAEKFCSPLSGEDFTHIQSTLYRTGDMVRWLPDGNIEFIGRRDKQLKIRGFRVETGEIEKQLMKISTIREALVLSFERSDNEKYLCAYIVSHETIDPAGLKKVLSRVLPGYMIPSYFMPLESIPLTANGKIDRKALQNPEVKIEDHFIAPRNEIEEILANIWSGVLQVEKTSISIDSNFFDMGGHSLDAISLISNIHKALNLKLRLEDIFVKPTLRELGQFIKDATEELYSAIDAVETKEYYSLSSAQKRLLFIQEMDAGNTAYNVPLLVRLEGNLDKARLEKSAGKLLKRHESLRTSFKMIKGEPVQRIHRDVEFEIQYFDPFKNQSGEPQDPEIEIILQGFVAPFDLCRPPLLRVGLLELTEETHLLMMDQHHIITDGTSMDIFVTELLALYEGKTLAPVKIRYIDFSQWQNKLLNSEQMKKQEEYWLKCFEGNIPVLNIPVDFPRLALNDFEGGTVNFMIDGTQTEKLVELGRNQEATLFMVILVLYNILLSKLSDQEDIIMGTTIEGRRHADLENVIGTFVNMLALRNYSYANLSFNALLQHIKVSTLKAFDNQDYQFEDLVSRLNVKRDKSRNPLFDVVFTYNNPTKEQTVVTGNDIPVLKPLGNDYIKKISKFDLTLICTERHDKLLFRFDYRAKLFKKTTIERFTRYFKTITATVLENPEKKVAEIEMMDEDEKRMMLEQIRNKRGKSQVNEQVTSQEATNHMDVEFNF